MRSERKTHIVLYDSDCSLCTFQMKLLTWLDWCNALSLLPISDPSAAEMVPQLTREELLEAIHCVSRQGHLYRAARCLRFVGMRLPLLIPLALILWIPGVIGLAEKAYARLSGARVSQARRSVGLDPRPVAGRAKWRRLLCIRKLG